MNIKVGLDPEAFLFKDKQYYPAIGLFGGTKEAPIPAGEGGGIQEDNVMVEFNTAPASTLPMFKYQISLMKSIIEERAKNMGFEIKYDPIATFSEDLLTHPQAREIGCSPDYNAWHGGRNESVNASDLKNIRTASGHIHIGFEWLNNHPYNKIYMVQALELMLGVPLSLIESDKSVTRRQYYGMSGSFRRKPYGIEWRTPDNTWITKDVYVEYVWNTIIRIAPKIKEYAQLANRYGPNIRIAINNHDKTSAEALMKTCSIQRIPIK